MPRGRKKMTEEHKEKIQEARRLKKEKEEKNKVEFKIDKFFIESYEYGYKIWKKDDMDFRFFSDLKMLGKFILNEKVKVAGAKDVKSFIEAIEKAEKSVTSSINTLSFKKV